MMQADGDRGAYAAVIWSMSACPSVVLAPLEERGFAGACRSFNRAVASELPALARAGLTGIVLASRYFGFPNPRAPPETFAAWRSGFQDIVSTARHINARILVIAPIPTFRFYAAGMPRACLGRPVWRQPRRA